MTISRRKYNERIIYSLLLATVLNVSVADELMDARDSATDLAIKNEQLSNKFRLVSYLLSNSTLQARIKTSNNEAAILFLDRAETDYKLAKKQIKEENWLEANAIVDSVIRDLTKIAKLVSESKHTVKQYQDALQKVKSFVLPKSEKTSEEDSMLLQTSLSKISELMASAEHKSKQGNYRKAISELNEAYALKASLLDEIKHSETIFYVEDYKTDDEYKYLLKRTEHYLGLVNMVLGKKQFREQTKKSIDTYVYQSKEKVKTVADLAKNVSHEKAIDVLNESVSDLTDALKIMGIRV